MSKPTLLITAARDGNLSVVKKCIAHGHSVDERDKDMASALYWASCRGHEKVCEYLLEVGSDVNACVKWGATPLSAAVDNQCVSCVKILLESPGVNINVQNERGDTPLHMAAYRGNLDILCMLTAYGADPLLKNGHSITAVQEAYAQQHRECTQHLLQYMKTYGISSFSSLPPETQSPPSKGLPETSEKNYSSWPMDKSFACKSHLPHVSNVESQLTPSSQNVSDIKRVEANSPRQGDNLRFNVSSNNGALNHLENAVSPPFKEFSKNRSQSSSIGKHSCTGGEKTASSSYSTSIQDAGVSSDNYPNSRETGLSRSFSELADQDYENSDGLSFESLLSNCLPISAKQGSPFPPEKHRISTNSIATDQMLRTTPKQHQQGREPQETSSPPELPPRPSRYIPQRYKQRNGSPRESDEHNFEREYISVSKQSDNAHTFRNNGAGAATGSHVLEYIEELQLEMSELQAKLLQSEATNAHLNDIILRLQEDNKVLRYQNQHQMKMSSKNPRTRNLQSRGLSDWDPQV